MNDLTTTATAGAPAKAGGPTTPMPASFDEVKALADRAEKGDESALPALRKILAEGPDAWWDDAYFLLKYGSPDLLLESSLIRHLCGKDDLAMREGMGRRLAEMRKDLAGESPTLIERLLADRVAFSWLQVTLYEALYANLQGLDPQQASFQLRRIDSANSRF